MRTEIAWRTDENGMLLGPAVHDSSPGPVRLLVRTVEIDKHDGSTSGRN
jgi:hypothetical protein